MEKQFEGKYAIITGASSGIGQKTAILMASRGLEGALIVGRNMDNAMETAAECEKLGCKCFTYKCNVEDPDEIRNMVNYAKQVFPTIHILINNAGTSPYTQWYEEDEQHWDYVMNVNVRSHHIAIQEVLKVMQPQKYGKIVNVASICARIGTTIASVSYAASKAGVLGLTRAYAKIAGPDGITVNAVLPGVTKTPMTCTVDYSNSIPGIPLRRLGEAEDIAYLIAFLASDESNWITGASYDINGGVALN